MKKAEKPASSNRGKNDKADKASKPAAKKGAPAKKGAKGEPEVKAKPVAKPPAKAPAKAPSKGRGKEPAAPAKKKVGAAPAKGRGRARGQAEPVELVEVSDAVQESLPLAGGEPAVEASAEAASDRGGADTGGEGAADLVDEASEESADDSDGGEDLSDEERELSSIYQEDLASPSLAHGEFKDQKTADEDRPMLPEINARDERRRTWEDRRERRRLEREQRRAARRERANRHDRGPAAAGGRPEGRPEGRAEGRSDGRVEGRSEGRVEGRSEGRAEGRSDGRVEGRSEGRAEGPRSAAGATSASGAAAAGALAAPAAPAIGTAMANATAALFAQLRNGQPLPVRQLAAMLRKRGLIEGEPEQVWPQLRAELLADERAHRTIGLRPRVVHRGRDLFAPGPASLSTVAELEGQLVASVAAISAATARGLTAWMASASPAAFERLIHAYVVAVGYRDVEWIKRVEGISYAQAIAPGIERPVLLSARSGAGPIDRRGVGELRVGVEAKGLPFGTLFAAGGLSPEAERELERAGRSIYVVCGDALAAALLDAGIGVARTAVSVRFLDDQFLEDLSSLPV